MLIRHTHVEVYVFRRRRARVEFLALRRAATRRHLPGVWQPVTGKMQWRERAFDAAVREVKEETGLDPRAWWALETVTTYFDPAADTATLLPLFAAEVGVRDRVELSDEHDAFRFLTSGEAARRYLWEAQRHALDCVRRQVLDRKDLAAALEVKPSRARRRASSARYRP